MKGMKDSEYEACVRNLGLLEGEEIRLQYLCFRNTTSPPSIWDGKSRTEFHKGLLVFTNDNMIFMQQEGAWSSSYAQALRVPLENISGVVSGGMVTKHIRILVGVSGSSEQHEFVGFQVVEDKMSKLPGIPLLDFWKLPLSQRLETLNVPIQDVRAEIEQTLKQSREEKKRLAQEVIAKGTTPTMIFCRYCGARNKADQPKCQSCGALL